MGWRKWRSSPSLNHQADLGKQVEPRASRMGVGGPYGTLRKGECSCILCSFAPNPPSFSSHSSKKSTMWTFPRSIRFPRIPPSLLRSSPSLLSGSTSTSFFSSPRSSTLSSFPSSPCLRYIKKRGKSRARLDMSNERGKSEKIVERGKRVDGGKGLGGRMGLRGEVQPRRWHSLQSLLCHTRWDNPIHSQFPLPKILHFCIFCIFLPYKVGQSNALSISSLQTIVFLHLCIFFATQGGPRITSSLFFPHSPLLLKLFEN